VSFLYGRRGFKVAYRIAIEEHLVMILAGLFR